MSQFYHSIYDHSNIREATLSNLVLMANTCSLRINGMRINGINVIISSRVTLSLNLLC
jgi:hypothetical protein